MQGPVKIYCIYNAKGSVSGELAYLFKKYVYGAKCSMCEISHDSFTIKRDWKNKVSQLNINLETVHLDERPKDLEEFSKNNVPCVVGEYQDGYKLILTNEDLKNLEGNVDLFFDMLEERIELHHHSELKI
tara:strand:- start:180 stop:569 length:390 start_codon:yes stop_codon:yes gene_type:complete